MVRIQPTVPADAKTNSSAETVMTVETMISPLAGHMPIHLGDGALDLLPGLLQGLSPDKVIIISDPHVFDLYGTFLIQILSSQFALEVILIPEGEGEKKLSTFESLCKELFERGATKSTVVVNFGGGVVLNIGGMAASMIYRGIRFVHVPTTLMAQSDVIVSNKQSVNFAGGKNRLGLFSLPVAAFADPRFFATEMPRQLRASLVEYCKNAILLGGAHFETARRFFAEGNPLAPGKLRQLLRYSLEQKFEIAKQDPTERGFGLILEYGHTIGHVVEFLSQGRVLHGEAVFHGMNVAGRLANKLGILPDAEHNKQMQLLGSIPEIPGIPAEISVGQIMQSVQRDNKKRDKGLAFILMQAIGKPHRHGESMLTTVPEEVLHQILLDY